MRCGEAIDNQGHLQWNIFFVERRGIDIGIFWERIKVHPFVASLVHAPGGNRPARPL